MKLTANELRIGNLFDHFEDGVLPIEEIKKDSDGFDGYYAVFRNNSIKCRIDYLDPIPLTEEWLFKFGFGKSEEHEYGSNENDLFGFYYDYHFNKFYLDTPEDNIYIPFIKYVHQLQNLYISLTNTELKPIK